MVNMYGFVDKFGNQHYKGNCKHLGQFRTEGLISKWLPEQKHEASQEPLCFAFFHEMSKKEAKETE